MSSRCFAFLRAINVGGRTVRMDDLRRHFEDLGLDDVTTFIASGNVIFDARGPAGRQLETRIEKHLASRLGYEVATFLRSIDQLEAITASQPFAQSELNAKESRLYVGFLRDVPGPAGHHALHALRSDTDSLASVGREVFWLSRTTSRESPVSGARIEKAIGGPATLRNINTVNRLIAKYGE
jgi:uncharacterized protein (DUF1697 family)